MSIELTRLYEKMQRPPLPVEQKRIIGIDPGGTTGVSAWNIGGEAEIQMIHWDQIKTAEMPEAAATMADFLNVALPDLIVMEEYRIYNWKTRSHANSDVHTLRLIGAIQYIAHERRIPIVLQGAGEGKGFCTDEKLQAWGLYKPARRHSNDAIRHVAHYLLFGKDLFYVPRRHT